MQQIMNQTKYIVDIVMVTYNHEKYIEKAITSVLSQKTNFVYRLIIGDDCSTDGTTSICERYSNNNPDKILLLKANKNEGIISNYLRCFKECTAEYICILEGDDYWIDNLKLEKQVKLLEKDKNIGLVHSNYTMYLEKYGKYKKTTKKLLTYCQNNQGNIYDELILHNFICPLTVMFRKRFLEIIDFSYLVNNHIITVDYFIWLNISLKSKIVYENEIFGIYRISDTSISNNSDIEKRIEFTETKNKILNYFIVNQPNKNISAGKIKHISHMRILLHAIKTFNFKYIAIYSKKISLSALFEVVKNYFKFYI